MVSLFQSLPFILKLIIGINLLMTGYNWVAPPIVVDVDFPDYYFAGAAFGPFIVVNTGFVSKNSENYEVTLKHEYAHFIQQALYSPLGLSLYNAWHVVYNACLYGIDRDYWFLYYKNNLIEEEAFQMQYDPSFKPPERYFNITLQLNW